MNAHKEAGLHDWTQGRIIENCPYCSEKYGLCGHHEKLLNAQLKGQGKPEDRT